MWGTDFLDCTSSPDVAGGEFPRSLGGRSESRSGEVAILKRSMAAGDEPSQTATMNREAEVAGLAAVRTTWLPALGQTRNENPPAGAGSAGPLSRSHYYLGRWRVKLMASDRQDTAQQWPGRGGTFGQGKSRRQSSESANHRKFGRSGPQAGPES